MAYSRYYVAHVVIEIDDTSLIERGLEGLETSVRVSLHEGMRARVHDAQVYEVAGDQHLRDRFQPRAKMSRELPIEKYLHCGMAIEIFRDTARNGDDRFFAIVTNPEAKQLSGSVLEADDPTSLPDIKALSEARAKRRAEQWAKRVQTHKPRPRGSSG